MDERISEILEGEWPHNLSEAELRLLFENMISPFSYFRMVYDAQGQPVDYVFVAVNKAFELETGKPREEIIGKSVLSIYPETESYWIESFGRVAKTGIPEHISNYSGALGRWYEITAYSPKPDYVAITVVNVTEAVHKRLMLMEKTDELNHQQSENYRLTYEEPVTRLPNRRSFSDAFREQAARAQEDHVHFAVVVIRLDGFSEINVSYGSVLGDQLLHAISLRLLFCTQQDERLFSLTGSEFILLTPRSCQEADQITPKVNQLLEEIGKPLEIEGNYFRLTASCGIACYPQHGVTEDDLLMCANLALYRTRKNGGDAFMIYSETLGQTLLNRTRIRYSLRKALDNHEFELYFQPQIDICSQKPIGFEALIRWHSAELGEVAPLSFIEIAEETRLIIPIGEWVIRSACEALTTLNKRFQKQFMMAVNISGVQLMQDGFIERVLTIVEQCGLPARLMELEITESVFMQRNHNVVDRLNLLAAKGFRIVLDDFGTGYSSLGMLSEVSISMLKIDKSFVEKTNSITITDIMVKMGHLLNTTVVAEGVETKKQQKFVMGIGCDRIQGFYYCKPLPLNELIAYLEKAL